MGSEGGAPVDWYRSSLSSNFDSLFWEEGGEEKARLAAWMLGLKGGDRILDLGCATGRRSLELARLGFEVVGVDAQGDLLEVADCEAGASNPAPRFLEADTRYLDFAAEFDVVLSLGGGAFEHFEFDEDCRLAFEAARRALKPGGRLLMQVPNLLHVEKHLARRVWARDGQALEMIEQAWDPETRRIAGTRTTVLDSRGHERAEASPFERRLYSLDELVEIFSGMGMMLTEVFDEVGRICIPSEEQLELFVEAGGVDGHLPELTL